MPQRHFKLSKLAQRHLIKVKEYTLDNYSELQWQRYKDTLLSGFQLLAENPDLGRDCSEIYPQGFYFHIGKHTAYFTKENGFILIVAVLNQSLLPEKHLKRR